MSDTYEMTARFVVPDDVGEENIEHVVGQFFADLEETERFIEARLVEGLELDSAERERLFDMLELVDDDCFEASGELAESLQED